MTNAVVALEWGVKQSFRGYVEAMGGVIETSGGAARTAEGVFVFAASDGNALAVADGALRGQGVFQGDVRFEAHGGMLNVRLAGFGLEIGPSGAFLTIADGPRRARIAELDLAASLEEGGALTVPATATLDTYSIVGDHYPPGTPLDPVRLVLG